MSLKNVLFISIIIIIIVVVVADVYACATSACVRLLGQTMPRDYHSKRLSLTTKDFQRGLRLKTKDAKKLII